MKCFFQFFLAFIFSLMLNSALNAQQIISLGDSLLQDIKKTEPVRKVLFSDNERTLVEYSFTGFTRTQKYFREKDWDFISIPGFAPMNKEVGKPSLPQHIDKILLSGSYSVKVNVKSVEYEEFSTYTIYPVLMLARDTKGAPEPTFEIDAKTYSTNAYYPSEFVNVIDVQEIRGIPLAMVAICPVQFNPVTGKIRVVKKIVYELSSGSVGASSPVSSRNSAHFYSLLEASVINPEQVAALELKSTVAVGGYLLITTDDCLQAADTLAKWKRQLGYDVSVISKANWTAQEIKDTIHNRYNSAAVHPDFFVLLGDVDRCPGELISSDNFSCDLYFACMDGASDFMPDMAHGRISVADPSEALLVVQKIINYERNPVPDPAFYSYGLHCAQFQDDDSDGYADRRFTQTSEDVLNYMTGLGMTTQRVYYTASSNNPQYWNGGYYSNGEAIPSYLLKPEFAWDGDGSDVVDGINMGPLYVLHRDHGYSGGWGEPNFNTSYISQLTNGEKLPVMFSINCSSGAFGQTACFAEQMLRKIGGGAVGVIAASNYSYSGYNDAFALGLFDAIWAVPGLVPNFTGSGGISNPSLSTHPSFPAMGDVLNQGLLRMTETWGVNSYTFELFHYHGDPAMKIWTAVPQVITATHDPSLQCDTTSLSILSCSCPDAIATLVYDGQLIGSVQLVNGTGTITFPSVTNIVPYAVLTISQTNFRPYITNIPIVNCQYPPVARFNLSEHEMVLCNGQTDILQMTDVSYYSPDTWLWDIQPASYSFVGGTSSASQNPQVVFNALGTYSVKLKVTNVYGVDSVLETDAVHVISGVTLPVIEDFEGLLFPPSGWSVDNPDGSYTWERNGSTAGNGLSTAAAYVRCFSYSADGELDGLHTPVLDLTTVTDARCDFKVAYHTFYSYCDTLRVYASTDCGNTFGTLVWKKGGTDLQTTSGTASFVPAIADDWRQESIDLSAYSGGSVVLRFECENQFGNNMYIDDINIYSNTSSPVADFYTSNTNIDCYGTSTPVDFYDLSLYNPTSWSWSVTPNNAIFIAPTNLHSQNPQILFTQYGDYSVTLTATNSNGSNAITKTSYVHIVSPQQLPLVEGFESGVFPPAGWNIVNPDADNTWEPNASASGNGSSTVSAYVDMYSYYPASGQEDDLISPPVDLTTVTSAILTFNLAYRTFSTYYDTLRVLISTDCGQTFDPNPLYEKSGLLLETSPGSGSFIPAVFSDWRNEVIDLSPWLGYNVVLSFQTANAFGNNLYIDDINIQSITGNTQITSGTGFLIYPNPATGSFSLAIETDSQSSCEISIFDYLGQKVKTFQTSLIQGLNNVSVSTDQLSPGLYMVSVKCGNFLQVKNLVIQ